jgi:general secretion pathway protein D
MYNATIVVHVVGSDSSGSALSLSGVTLTDTAGSQLPVVFSGSLTSQLVTPTPCPGGICPTATDTATPTATPTPEPLSCPVVIGVASMCLLPSASTANIGDTITVQVIVTNASDIGSYEFKIAYDPTVLTFNDAVDAGFLGSSGRTVQCPAPVTDTGTVLFGCVTIGSSPPGPDAPGVLATLTFTAVANVPHSSALQFTKSTLSDPLADAIAVSATDGSVTIQ